MARKTVDRKPSAHFKQEQEEGVIPILTAPMAAVYAKLLSIGCPPIRAVLYCAPKLDVDTCKALAREWVHSPLVLQALENEMGGAWMDLPAERRYELALEKHYAEMAFYLWTVNFGDVDHKDGLEKMKQAREVLRVKLGGEEHADDFTQAFARMAMALTQNMAESDSRKKKAPTLLKSGFDDLLDGPAKGKPS